MATLTDNEKKTLRDALERLIESSGISRNKYAERLKVSGGTITNILQYWNVEGKVGAGVWETVKKHIDSIGVVDGVPTDNFKSVFAACESAYFNKSAQVIIGKGGYGKSYALSKFKKALEKKSAGKISVHYIDASLSPKPKKLIATIMETLGCYKAGKMSTQLLDIANYFKSHDCLLVIDEVSALESKDVTVLKDILTAARGYCGVVLAGTPYFMDNVLRGKARNRHLFSELEDRFFSLPTVLTAPTAKDAEAIFKLYGLNDTQIDIALGRVTDGERYSWMNKPTYRGIMNCVQMMRDMDRAPMFDFTGVGAI
ncbi:MAG: AAA family ATPase [Marinifilaceae bacterium]